MPQIRPVKVTVVLEFSGQSSGSYAAITEVVLDRVKPLTVSDVRKDIKGARVRSVSVEDTGL